MPRFLRFGFALILLMALSVLPALADAPASAKKMKAKNPPPPPPMALRHPIVAKWTTLQGMRYYHEGFELDGKMGPTLGSVIYSLNDPQATALLRKSENDESVGLFGSIGGSGLFLTGLFTSNYNQQTNQINISPASAILMSVGLVTEFIGDLVLIESRTSKFAAVERYNQVVRGEDDPSVENWKSGQPADLSVAFNF